VNGALAALGALALLTLPFWLASPYHLTSSSWPGLHDLAARLNLLLGYTGQPRSATPPSSASAPTPRRCWRSSSSGRSGSGCRPRRRPARRLGDRPAGPKLRGAYFVLVTISFAGVISLVSVN
jgi:hypothetical protein